MVFWVRLLIVTAVGCGTMFKPPDPDRRLNVHTSGTMFDTDRGYRFVVLPEPSANVIRLDVRYPVGSIDDPVGKEGLAHLVEHLLTEVEVTRDGIKTSLDGQLGRVALSFNAQTTTDYTTYETLALPSALEDLMRVEAERISTGCAGIPRVLFDREREVVRNELRQHAGGGGSELLRQVHEAIYPAGHPYRRVDSSETVANITYEDVCAFLVGPYRRGTTIVAISGAVDVPALQRAVARQFGRVPRRIAAPAAATPLAPPQPGTVKLRGGVDEPTLLITWPLPPMSTSDYRLLAIAWRSLAGSLEAYAFTYHWGHSASTQIFGGPRAPVLGVIIVLNSASDLGEAKARLGSALRDTLYRVSQPGDDRETTGWVRRWEAEVETLLARWESLAGRNQLYSDALQFEPNGSVIGWIKELAAATPSATRTLAEHWLSTSRARYLLVEPSGSSHVVGGGRFSGVVEHHGTQVDRSLADKPLPAPPASLRPRAQRYTQDNGLTILMWPNGATPLVHARLVVDAGSSDDPFGREGVSQTVGASEIYADSMVFGDRNLAIRSDDLIRSVSSELRLPGYGLSDNGKAYLVARLEQRRIKERAAYEAEIHVALYGQGHPYARNSISAEGVKHLSHDSVRDWARGHITPRNSTLVIAGAFDPGLIKRHIAYNTDQVSSGTHTRDVKTEPRTTPSFLFGTTATPSPTVEIDLHYVAGRGIDPDYPQRLVLEAVLDSQLTQLREIRAITYGFSASYSPRRAGGLWTISGEVVASRAAEAGSAIIAILDDMRRDPESYRGAFVLARQKVLEAQLVDSTSSADVAEHLVTLARFGLPDDYYDHVASEVAQMTLPRFHAFLVRELDPATQVFGAFGNAEPAKAAATAARAVNPGARTPTIVAPLRYVASDAAASGRVEAAASDAVGDPTFDRSDLAPPLTLQGIWPTYSLLIGTSLVSGTLTDRDVISGRSFGREVTGYSFAAQASYRVTQSTSVGINVSLGSLGGSYSTMQATLKQHTLSVKPLALFGVVQLAGLRRLWAAGMAGVLFERVTVDTDESTSYPSLGVGLEAGVDLLKYELHRIGVFGRIETVFIAGDKPYDSLTLGLAYRR